MKKLFKRYEEKLRYLVVGGWNTVAGFLLFVTSYYLLSPIVHYVIILTIAYVLSITNAYICYKFLVFKTKGNYLREYFRFYLVYGMAYLLNLALLPFFVEILKIAPIVSQAIIGILTVIISYVAHKNFSFGSRKKGIQLHEAAYQDDAKAE